MNIEILKEEKDKIQFELSEASPAFANSLRRTLINNIPIMAIEDVAIKNNNSALFDEILAHRLGMIPLEFDPELFNTKKDCDCEDGCTQCEVVFVLEKEGPCMVRASDLKSTNPDVKPKFKDMPIVKLLEKQKINLEATAQLGKAKDHAKFQAANTGYKYKTKVKVYKDKCKGTKCKECIKACPKDIIVEKDGKIGLQNIDRCDACMKCVEVCPDDAILVSTDENTFIFDLETISGLSAKQTLKRAIEILKNNTEDFKNSL